MPYQDRHVERVTPLVYGCDRTIETKALKPGAEKKLIVIIALSGLLALALGAAIALS